MNDQNSHRSTDSTNIDFASDRVNGNMDYFDAEVLASLVKGGMGRGGNDSICVFISTVPRRKTNKLTSRAL